MLTKYLIYISLIPLVFTVPVLAQGEFLQENESGFGAGVDFPTGDHSYNYALSFGYSARAVMDVGFSYAEFTHNEARVYAPSLTFHLAGPKPNQPIGFAFTAAYEWVSYNDSRLSRSTDSFLLGLSLYGHLLPPGTVLIQPAITGGAVLNTDASTDDSDLFVSFGLALLWNRQGAVRPFIFASLPFVGNDKQTILGLGLVAAW
jgi:hypothetical protein